MSPFKLKMSTDIFLRMFLGGMTHPRTQWRTGQWTHRHVKEQASKAFWTNQLVFVCQLQNATTEAMEPFKKPITLRRCSWNSVHCQPLSQKQTNGFLRKRDFSLLVSSFAGLGFCHWQEQQTRVMNVTCFGLRQRWILLTVCVLKQITAFPVIELIMFCRLMSSRRRLTLFLNKFWEVWQMIAK